MTAILQDIRYATRLMVATPGFSAVVVLTLGVAIGVNTTLFSVLNAVWLQAVPVRNAERLVAVWNGRHAARRACSLQSPCGRSSHEQDGRRQNRWAWCCLSFHVRASSTCTVPTAVTTTSAKAAVVRRSFSEGGRTRRYEGHEGNSKRYRDSREWRQK